MNKRQAKKQATKCFIVRINMPKSLLHASFEDINNFIYTVQNFQYISEKKILQHDRWLFKHNKYFRNHMLQCVLRRQYVISK